MVGASFGTLRFLVVLGAMTPYVQNLRVQKALQIWHKSPFEIDAVILSGNTKNNNIRGGATESVQMLRGMQGDFARARKAFPRDKIVLEVKSNNTAQNALCTLLKIKAYKTCVPHRHVHVTVVTNFFHMRRTRVIFERVAAKLKQDLLIQYEPATDPQFSDWRKNLEDDVLYNSINDDIKYAFEHRAQCGTSEGECSSVSY